MLKENHKLQIEKTTHSSLPSIDWDNLPFGKVFSDHMIEMDFVDGQWQDAKITPFKNLSLHPATSAIHYGQSIFEGMKAYRNEKGEVVLFRPEMNAKRFMESAKRMCMPTMDTDVFVSMIKELVKFDKDWIPNKEGYSLYIRPFMFAMDDYIGIKPSDTYKFLIFTCPVGAYYADPINVKIEEHYTRAAAGGVGRAKTAGNYAASLYPAKLGVKDGFHQLIWTDSKEHKYIEESGTMNIVFEKDGKLITPSEEDDTILQGITKRSVVEIAKHWGIEVEERKVSVEEIIDALRKGEITDVFGAGTAATIAPIAKIGYRDELFELPPVEDRELSKRIKQYMDDIKTGKVQDELNWCTKVC